MKIHEILLLNFQEKKEQCPLWYYGETGGDEHSNKDKKIIDNQDEIEENVCKFYETLHAIKEFVTLSRRLRTI